MTGFDFIDLTDFPLALSPEEIAAENAQRARAQVEREKAVKKTDGIMHGMITLALANGEKKPWLDLMDRMVAANKAGELRTGVKKRFFEAMEKCPHKDICFRIDEEFRTVFFKSLNRNQSLKTASVTASKLSRAEIEKRRAKNRSERKGPAKGGSGGKQEPSSDKKKGDKKKK